MSAPKSIRLTRINKTDPNAYQNTRTLDSALAKHLAAGNQRSNQRVDPETLKNIRKRQILAFTDRPENPLPSGEITSLGLNFMSDAEIMRRSVLEITSSASEGHKTVNDPILGSIRDDVTCGRCQGTGRWCRGHYGHINLNFKMLHPAGIVPRSIVSILNCICNNCGGLLLSRDVIETQLGKYHGAQRLKMLEKLSKDAPCLRNKKCPPNPIYLAAEAKKGKIQYSYDRKNKERIIDAQVEDIEKLLNAISDEDARLMGFNIPEDPNAPNSHPKRLIISKILVFPPCSRPGGEVDGEVRTDHITQIYMDIIRFNNLIKTEPTKAREHIERVKNSYAALIDNKGTNVTISGKNGQEHRTISHRLDGKEGLIRYNIFGKSSDFTARTPISPGPHLRPGQIGVPREIAKKLTVRKRIFNANRQYMQRLMEQGQVYKYYPSTGERAGESIIINNDNRTKYILEPGDEVDRFIQNGDRCILLRNPVLHKQSIMGYEIVIVDGLSIQLPLFTTTPHNADFDGDEMTLHIVQDTYAESDIINVMAVEQCLIDAQTNSMAMAIVQDALLGGYLLTTTERGPHGARITNNVLSRYIYMIASKGRAQIATWEQRLQKAGVPRNTGYAVFSLVLPEDLNYWQSGVRIINGIMVSGIISKKHIGVTQDTIIQQILKAYGEDGRRMTMQFIEDVYELLGDYMTRQGHSVTLDDCQNRDPNIAKRIKEVQQQSRNNIIELGPKLQNATLERRRDKQIDAYLGDTTAKIADILNQGLPENNALKIMAKSGAKGSISNIAGIMAGLGPQRALNKRIAPQLNRGSRCLPHYSEGDLDPVAHGYCVNNLLQGLTPVELVYQQASARDDLSRMGLKSADTGTLSMEMIKNMENLRTDQTELVLNANDGIVSILYGGDGFNTESLVRVKGTRGPINFWTNIFSHADQLNNKYGQNTSNISEYVNNRETYELERELIGEPDDEYEYEYDE